MTALAIGFDTVLTTVQMIAGLGFVVFVHELGHFLVAKWADVKVERFSLGFGPKLVAFRRGETEYCISAIPLGGYVKMAGETTEDEKTGDPREFAAKPAGWRAAILMAGVAMNCVFAVPLLSLAILLGGGFRANQTSAVGGVVPGSAAETAGFLPGDRVVSVNGAPASRWLDLEAVQAGSEIGLSGEWPDRIGDFDPAAFPGLAGVRPGDRIISMNGVPFSSRGDLHRWILGNPGGALSLTIAPAAGGTPARTVSLTVARREQFESGITIEPDPSATIGEVVPGGPAAKAGLLPGDRVVKVDDDEVATWNDMRGAIQRSTASGILLTIERGGKTLVVPVEPTWNRQDAAPPLAYVVERAGTRQALTIPATDTGRRIGISAAYRISGTKDAASPLVAGDVIRSVRFTPETGEPRDWSAVALDAPSAEPGAVAVSYLRDGRAASATIPLAPRAIGHLEFPANYVERVYPRDARWGPVSLVSASTSESAWILTFSARRLADLARSVTRGETHMLKQLSGPLGIGAMTFVSVQQGHSPYFWMLGLISLSLALMNVLPIPLLDGGHLLFLVFEKIRGKPVSEKVQVYTQYTALAALLGMVLLATWNDINIIDQLRRLSR